MLSSFRLQVWAPASAEPFSQDWTQIASTQLQVISRNNQFGPKEERSFVETIWALALDPELNPLYKLAMLEHLGAYLKTDARFAQAGEFRRRLIEETFIPAVRTLQLPPRRVSLRNAVIDMLVAPPVMPMDRPAARARALALSPRLEWELDTRLEGYLRGDAGKFLSTLNKNLKAVIAKVKALPPEHELAKLTTYEQMFETLSQLPDRNPNDSSKAAARLFKRKLRDAVSAIQSDSPDVMERRERLLWSMYAYQAS